MPPPINRRRPRIPCRRPSFVRRWSGFRREVVDVEARLADKLRGIEFPDTPLFQFLAELSQMSTIPISLDADALAEMGLSADATVSVALKETTVAEGLKRSDRPARLGLPHRESAARRQVGPLATGCGAFAMPSPIWRETRPRGKKNSPLWWKR